MCSISNLIGKNVPSSIIQSIYRHNSHDIVKVFSRTNLILYTFIIQIQITIMILLWYYSLLFRVLFLSTFRASTSLRLPFSLTENVISSAQGASARPIRSNWKVTLTIYLLNGLVVSTCLSYFIKMKKKKKFSFNQIDMNYENPNK